MSNPPTYDGPHADIILPEWARLAAEAALPTKHWDFRGIIVGAVARALTAADRAGWERAIEAAAQVATVWRPTNAIVPTLASEIRAIPYWHDGGAKP